MPARDNLHPTVRRALIKDGWTITHDPLHLRLQGGRRSLFIDLGAERLIAAEKGSQKIAVEIKGFAGPSDVRELEEAERALYLAVPEFAWRGIFAEEIGQVLLEDSMLRVLAFDPNKEVIVQWTL